MSKKPSSCGGGDKKCPPKALTDKLAVNLGNLEINNGKSQQYLGIKPKLGMSKKMSISQRLRHSRLGR